MPGKGRKKANGSARPIRTQRDYMGASAVVKRLAAQKSRDAAAEARLKSLLRELDRFDDEQEDFGADLPGDDEYTGPHRRWSDDDSGLD